MATARPEVAVIEYCGTAPDTRYQKTKAPALVDDFGVGGDSDNWGRPD